MIADLNKHHVEEGYQQKESLRVWKAFMREAKEFSAADVDLVTSGKFAGRFHAQPKACFFNSLKIAKKLEGYQYFEGFATCMIPCEHAWVVSPEGKVIDVTWIRFFDDGDDRVPQDYYGVAVPWKEAMGNREKNIWQPSWVDFLMKGDSVHVADIAAGFRLAIKKLQQVK